MREPTVVRVVDAGDGGGGGGVTMVVETGDGGEGGEVVRAVRCDRGGEGAGARVSSSMSLLSVICDSASVCASFSGPSSSAYSLPE